MQGVLYGDSASIWLLAVNTNVNWITRHDCPIELVIELRSVTH
jgi:hypothetical protein